MEIEARRKSWGLVQSPAYFKEYSRLPSKYRNQISRKAHELMSDPRPGGSRTPLKGYEGLCRLRAGDFRVIYAYNAKVVELLTLRRRDEHTYDDLDEMEIQQLDGFRLPSEAKSESERIADWEELAKKWAAPKPKPVEPLPQPITAAMLDELAIPAAFKAPMLQVTTADGLLDCEVVPLELRQKVLDRICPQEMSPVSQVSTPVVVLDDLVDPRAAVVCGPIDASDGKGFQPAEVDMRDSEGKPGTMENSGGPARPKIPTPLIVESTRRQDPMTPYRGNTSKGIGKDTRYTVKLDGAVQLVYCVGSNERALLTTEAHPELVDLVNEAKLRGGSSSRGGGFLIDEYRHVLVPTQGRQVLYAGAYTRDLEFDFETTLISPVAPPGIRPGDLWPGPHVGIRYTLAAGATDIRYEEDTVHGTIRRVCLTDHHSTGALAELLQIFRAMKPDGGAIYVNEAREFFAPVADGKDYKRRYIGHLGDRPWFPEPT